jgi:hypothetical protein
MVEAAMRALTEIRAIGEVSDLVFAITRMTGRNLDLIVDEAEPGGSAVASLSFESQRVRQRAILVERPDEAAARHPYDEDSLRAGCRIDVPRRTIRLEGISILTPLETMVAMTKALHLALFAGKAGQWVFCRLEAPRWPLASATDGLAISLAQTVGTRLTKSRVGLRDELLAWLYFALREHK